VLKPSRVEENVGGALLRLSDDLMKVPPTWAGTTQFCYRASGVQKNETGLFGCPIARRWQSIRSKSNQCRAQAVRAFDDRSGKVLALTEADA